jgi:hypothetical protein
MVINVHKDVTLERIRKEVENLMPDEQLKLVDILIHKLMKQEIVREKTVNLGDFYGLGKGLWKGDDAQDYVNKLRDERI